MVEKMVQIQDLLKEALIGKKITHWGMGWGKELVTVIGLDLLTMKKWEPSEPFVGVIRLCLENVHGRRVMREMRLDDVVWMVEEDNG